MTKFFLSILASAAIGHLFIVSYFSRIHAAEINGCVQTLNSFYQQLSFAEVDNKSVYEFCADRIK